jgi:hypothetical protein
MTEERLPRAGACCRSMCRGRAKAPLRHSLVVIWLIWLLLVESSGAQSQPHGQQQRQHGTLPALKAFLARPLSLKAPPRADTLPDHLARQQTEMLQALHRHKVQDAMTALRPATSSSAGSSGGSSSAKELRTRWPLGYVAVCAVVKDQPRELRYWIEYHRWLGIDKFYLFDNNSSRPLLLGLWDLVQAGVVDYQYFVGERVCAHRPGCREGAGCRSDQGLLVAGRKRAACGGTTAVTTRSNINTHTNTHTRVFFLFLPRRLVKQHPTLSPPPPSVWWCCCMQDVPAAGLIFVTPISTVPTRHACCSMLESIAGWPSWTWMSFWSFHRLARTVVVVTVVVVTVGCCQHSRMLAVRWPARCCATISEEVPQQRCRWAHQTVQASWAHI